LFIKELFVLVTVLVTVVVAVALPVLLVKSMSSFGGSNERGELDDRRSARDWGESPSSESRCSRDETKVLRLG
jgi:hypothetical protein